MLWRITEQLRLEDFLMRNYITSIGSSHEMFLFDFTSHDPPHTHTQSEYAVSEGLCDNPVQSYEEAIKLRLPLG